jgi:hypothetical protein
MDSWIIWEIIAEQRMRNLRQGQQAPIEGLEPPRPGLRQRLAALLVSAGLRLDAEAGRAVRSPVQNHT